MSGNNQGEPAFILLMLLALMAALSWLIWHASREVLLDIPLRWIHFAELWPINFATHRYDACMEWLRTAQVNDLHPSPRVIAATNACYGRAFLSSVAHEDLPYYYQMSYVGLGALTAEAMTYYRWLISVGIGYVFCYVMFWAPENKFKIKHNLESFIKTQAKMWPIITPILKFNPSKTGRILGEKIPDKLPLFAEALSPEEWVSWCRIPVVNGIPDRDAARLSFVRQLGPRWTGIDSLPRHMRALMAAFALRGAQKRDESDDLLGRLAVCWSPEKGFAPHADLINEIDKILADPKVGGLIVPVADNFAWRTTAILGVLRWARNNGGVLAPAQFLWVRAEDRALWYPLNNLGRRSYHSEAAGALAHFMAEEHAQKPLPIPRVDTAIVTLNTYLHDPDKRTIAIPPREESAKA